MKKYLYFLMSAVLIVMSAGCSSEGEDINNTEGIITTFHLLNENGEETTTFKSGENIFFDLEIVNNCDTMMVFTSENQNNIVIQQGISKDGADLFFPLSNEDLFSIYDKKGEKIGNPYTGLYCNTSFMKVIEPHSNYHARCNWKETGEGFWQPDVTFPFCKLGSMEDLPVGEYYISFRIKCRNNAKDPKSQFKTLSFLYQFAVVE